MMERRGEAMTLDAPWLPNLFYVCLVIGLWVTALALVSPGTGVLEALALLLLGGAAVGMLTWPVNALAFIPLILGAAAFVMGLIRREQASAWLMAAAILLSLGSIFLFEDRSGDPAVQPVLAIVMSALTVLIFWVGVRRGLEAQFAAPAVAAETVVGQIGEARSPVYRSGEVYVGGEMWSARSARPIPEGARVRVRHLDGLVVEVEQVE
jgi:membrane-bound serine protease (ClpP class)